MDLGLVESYGLTALAYLSLILGLGVLAFKLRELIDTAVAEREFEIAMVRQLRMKTEERISKPNKINKFNKKFKSFYSELAKYREDTDEDPDDLFKVELWLRQVLMEESLKELPPSYRARVLAGLHQPSAEARAHYLAKLLDGTVRRSGRSDLALTSESKNAESVPCATQG